MADSQIYTNEAAFQKAAKIQASLVTSKLRMFDAAKLTSVNVTTKRTDLVAAECTFDGYTAGGYALAAFTGPGTTPGGGATITSPLVNAVYGPAGDPPVTNAVGGWWIEDDTMTTPVVRLVGSFSPTRPMGNIGDIITMVLQMVEGRNPTTPPSS